MAASANMGSIPAAEAAIHSLLLPALSAHTNVSVSAQLKAKPALWRRPLTRTTPCALETPRWRGRRRARNAVLAEAQGSKAGLVGSRSARVDDSCWNRHIIGGHRRLCVGWCEQHSPQGRQSSAVAYKCRGEHCGQQSSLALGLGTLRMSRAIPAFGHGCALWQRGPCRGRRLFWMPHR